MNKMSLRPFHRWTPLLILGAWLWVFTGCGGKKEAPVNGNPIWAAREEWARANLQKEAEKIWPDMGPSFWPCDAFVHKNSYWAVDSHPRPFGLGWDLVRLVFYSPADPRNNRFVGAFHREPHGWEPLIIEEGSFRELWEGDFTTSDQYGLGSEDGN